MQHPNNTSGTLASYALAAVFLLTAFALGRCSSLLAAEPNQAPPDDVTVRMLHVFIQADLNDVRFENVWVFQRSDAGRPWQVCINLPARARSLQSDEPNQTSFSPTSLSVLKTMDANSLLDSVGFSYLLPNRSGACSTTIVPAWPVNSMVVSLSGPAVRLLSNRLNPDAFRQSRSGFSAVYTAVNLPADATVEVNLSGLPRRTSGLPQTICTLALALIFLAAAVTMYSARNPSKSPE